MEEQEKKKGIFNKVGRGYIKPFKGALSVIPNAVKGARNTASSTAKRVVNSKGLYEANLRDPDIEAMKENFENIKLKWGFEEEDIEGLIKYYKMHLLSSIIGIVLSLIYLITSLYLNASWFAVTSIFLFTMVISLLASTNYWRLSVLRDRKFTPFFEWAIK